MTAAPALHAVGRSVPKPDAWLKATGTATYAGDVRLPGMLEARLLHSPHPHARIVRIDTGAAAALPGVYAVVTGSDVAPTRIGNGIRDRYALARDRVIYVGEPVAAVAAIDEETAERAVGLIEVEYEPLPAVFDAESALHPDAPILHPELADYEGSPPTDRRGNQRNHIVHEVGDVDAAFREPGLILHEATYVTPRQHPSPTEPHAALAQVDGAGHVTVWASIKAPFRARLSVARTLGVPLARVRLISPLIGGDFGGKGGGFVEPIVALLAREARRPVRLTLSRAEEIGTMISRPGYTIGLKIGARPDGTIVAFDGRQLANIGAVDDYGPDRLNRATALLGAYRIPNLRLTSTWAYTNTSPAGHVRSPSGPQNHFALESHIDGLARKLGIDPFDLRLKNVLRNGDVVPSGHGILHNSGLEECIRRARGWRDDAAARIKSGADAAMPLQADGTPRGADRWRRGVGVALCSWSLGPKPYTVDSAASVKVDVDGSVTVLTGATDQGGGQWSMAAQVASEVLGVPMDRVHVIAADTEATPNEIGTSGSNVTYRVGNSVRQAAEDARRQLLRVAGQRLKADEEELVLADDAVFRRADPAERLSVAALARAAAGSAEGTILGTSAAVRAEEVRQHGREQAETVDSPAFGCHVAQVRVDSETGQVEVERYCAVHDVGHALNPMNCVGQVQGGVVFGLGYALSEELITQDGTNVNANLWEYLLPTAPHVPEITVELVEVPSTFGPFGAKGLGEAPVIGVPAAIANAVEDAIGVRVTEAPLTPERILGSRQ